MRLALEVLISKWPLSAHFKVMNRFFSLSFLRSLPWATLDRRFCFYLCPQLVPKQSKEPLISHEVPDRPWAKIANDLLEYENKSYLVNVYYFSNFFEIDRLYSTTSSTVTPKLKAHMAHYGIPKEVVSDAGPQFRSNGFNTFAKKYGFKHTLTSPYHHQSNGMAESAVKYAKRVLAIAKLFQLII